jgi:hypothetical protein
MQLTKILEKWYASKQAGFAAMLEMDSAEGVIEINSSVEFSEDDYRILLESMKAISAEVIKMEMPEFPENGDPLITVLIARNWYQDTMIFIKDYPLSGGSAIGDELPKQVIASVLGSKPFEIEIKFNLSTFSKADIDEMDADKSDCGCPSCLAKEMRESETGEGAVH